MFSYRKDCYPCSKGPNDTIRISTMHNMSFDKIRKTCKTDLCNKDNLVCEYRYLYQNRFVSPNNVFLEISSRFSDSGAELQNTRKTYRSLADLDNRWSEGVGGEEMSRTHVLSAVFPFGSETSP